MISSHGEQEQEAQEAFLAMTGRRKLISEVRVKKILLLIVDQSADSFKKEQPSIPF